jgi:hypothetical protein
MFNPIQTFTLTMLISRNDGGADSSERSPTPAKPCVGQPFNLSPDSPMNGVRELCAAEAGQRPNPASAFPIDNPIS